MLGAVAYAQSVENALGRNAWPYRVRARAGHLAIERTGAALSLQYTPKQMISSSRLMGIRL